MSSFIFLVVITNNEMEIVKKISSYWPLPEACLGADH